MRLAPVINHAEISQPADKRASAWPTLRFRVVNAWCVACRYAIADKAATLGGEGLHSHAQSRVCVRVQAQAESTCASVRRCRHRLRRGPPARTPRSPRSSPSALRWRRPLPPASPCTLHSGPPAQMRNPQNHARRLNISHQVWSWIVWIGKHTSCEITTIAGSLCSCTRQLCRTYPVELSLTNPPAAQNQR